MKTSRSILAATLGLALAACGSQEAPAPGDGEAPLTGTVRVDGSSTVFPITEAVAEEFRAVEPRVRVTVGISGTGGGFKKFTIGETDINDASRPIKETEIDAAAAAGVEFIELPIAYDGLSVVVNPANDWVDDLTVEELQRIWQPGSTVRTWSDVRPGWPDEAIALYGPGTDSGTFDYFTEAIVGKAQAARPDFTASEDDNVLVQGVSGDVNALGFFGFAYYAENAGRLKIVPIRDGEGDPVAPSEATIADGSYTPLSRPIFIYVGSEAARQPAVRAFVSFYLEHAATLAREVGYVGLPAEVYALARQRFTEGLTGSVYQAEGASTRPLAELYRRQEGR